MIDETCKKIIKELDIHLFVETGTNLGETVAEVAGWFSDADHKAVAFRTAALEWKRAEWKNLTMSD